MDKDYRDEVQRCHTNYCNGLGTHFMMANAVFYGLKLIALSIVAAANILKDRK